MPMTTRREPVALFLSYAHEDEALLRQLEVHLSLLKRRGLISTWHDRQIIAGTDWSKTIDEHLERAAIILLLVSPDFLASDYCYGVEMQRALERHSQKKAHAIPIFLRPVDWQAAPFAHLQGLPRDGKFVTEWDNRDVAFLEVVQGLRRLVESTPPIPVSTSPTTLLPLWNIPYPRNPVFTGREQFLSLLADTLRTDEAATLSQPQVLAISGLGGIGKTQVAIEYAYQHQQDYQAILWIHADTAEALIAGYMEIAHLLNLPERNEQDQSLVVKAVQAWLKTQMQWLLILDNADDLALVHAFLPSTFGGHILLTTRAQAMGRLAKRMEVETMDPDVGALLLLRRAGLVPHNASLETALPSDTALAREVAQELGGLPLALDQAGAYLEETSCSLLEYQRLYRLRSGALLKERRGLVDDHPESVATTWSLSFQKVEEKDAAAADLLRLCAFFSPDAIPEEIITTGASELGPRLRSLGSKPLLLNEAIGQLLAYSLVHRQSDQTLSIHRLVQVVLKADMNKLTKRRWAERAVRAVEVAFPETDYENWLRCQYYLPQAYACANLIEQWDFTFPEATGLLVQTGRYLRRSAQYAQAEPLFQQALAIRERVLGDHPHTATTLNDLALLYENQGRYEEAEPLLLRALAIHERMLGDHPWTTVILKNLASLYRDQGKYEQAETLFQRALDIRARVLADDPGTATILDTLALLYGDQGRYEEAKPLFQRALAIQERVLGDHPHTAATLNHLASLYQKQGRYEEAELLYQRALAIQERVLGDHPYTAATLKNLASLYQTQGKYEEAEPLYQRALAIRDKLLGPQHPKTATIRENYNALVRKMNERGKGSASSSSP